MAIRDTDRGMKKIKRALIAGSGKKAVAGIQGPEADSPHGDDGVRNIDVAVWAEFGTVNAPQRSFIGATVDRKRRNYIRLMDRAVRMGAEGQDMDRAFGRLALKMAADMQQTINESIELEPLADSTIRARRSALGIINGMGVERPLLFTGQLKRSVTGIVVKA